MKNIALFILCFILILQYPIPTSASPPIISAQAASLIDVESGRILYQRNGDQPLPIASLTKIMTAIVAIENGNLSDMVTAGPNAVKQEGSSIYLRLGEKLSLEHMLYGLMLRSGNDAAVAIAEHVGGSVEGFAFLMNQKAEFLGLKNTHFVNPHGLDHPDHYSSANDLARLTAYALKNPVFQEIVSTKVKTAPLEDKEWDRKWFNKNKMLRIYQGADGVKTGYTRIANRTLVSSATRDGRQIASVTLNDGNDWVDSARLLDYGFNEFHYVDIVQKGQKVEGVTRNDQKVTFSTYKEFKYPLKEGELMTITSKVEIMEENLYSGTFPGGFLNIYLDHQQIGSVPLLAESDVLAPTFSFTNEPSKPRSFWKCWLLFWRVLL